MPGVGSQTLTGTWDLAPSYGPCTTGGNALVASPQQSGFRRYRIQGPPRIPRHHGRRQPLHPEHHKLATVLEGVVGRPIADLGPPEQPAQVSTSGAPHSLDVYRYRCKRLRYSTVPDGGGLKFGTLGASIWSQTLVVPNLSPHGLKFGT